MDAGAILLQQGDLVKFCELACNRIYFNTRFRGIIIAHMAGGIFAWKQMRSAYLMRLPPWRGGG